LTRRIAGSNAPTADERLRARWSEWRRTIEDAQKYIESVQVLCVSISYDISCQYARNVSVRMAAIEQ
jgi:hypothetical protein